MFGLLSRGTFYGGVFLPYAKAATEDKPIEALPVPPKITVPLEDVDQVVVRVGESVVAEQRLATSKCGRVDTYCPLPGKVLGRTFVETRYNAHAPALEIEVQGDPLWPPEPSTTSFAHWEELTEAEVSEALIRCSLIGQGGKGRRTADKIEQAKQRGVKDLIVNGMESEPCLTADHRILTEHTALIYHTAMCLQRYLQTRRSFVVVDAWRKELLQNLDDYTREGPIRTVGLQNRYPQGFAPLLIQALLGREVPTGAQPVDVGALVLNASTVFHLGRALALGRPLTARVTTVSGDAVTKPGNYWIPTGTPVSHVLESVGLRCAVERMVVGGPMTGRALSHTNVVLTPRCQALLAFSRRTVDLSPPRACIHCGWCLEVCPVRLDPATLLRAIELGSDAEAERGHVDSCIECGLCSYVCPSSLPLADAIISTKSRLAQRS